MTGSATVDSETIPLIEGRCNHYLGLIIGAQNRIRARREILAPFLAFERELSDTRVNPNPREMPCAIFMEIHAEFGRSGIRAVTAGDHPTANRLGMQAQSFHDEVWLMCDASDRTSMNRGLFDLALAHVRRAIANILDSIADAENELRGLRASYPSECGSFGHPLP